MGGRHQKRGEGGRGGEGEGERDGDGTALYVRTEIRGDLEGADLDEFFISGNDYEPESRQDHSLSS